MTVINLCGEGLCHEESVASYDFHGCRMHLCAEHWKSIEEQTKLSLAAIAGSGLLKDFRWEPRREYEETRKPAVVGALSRRAVEGPPPETCRRCGNVQKPSSEPVTRSNDVVCNVCGTPLKEPINA